MYRHMLGKLVLLSLLSLATGVLEYEDLVKPYRDKNLPGQLETYPSKDLNRIAHLLLEKILEKYTIQKIIEILNNKESIYGYGNLSDLPDSEKKYRNSLGVSIKIFVDPPSAQKIMDLPTTSATNSFGYDRVDKESNGHIKKILACTEDKSINVTGSESKLEFTDASKHFTLLNIGISPLWIEKKLMTANWTGMVQFGGCVFRDSVNTLRPVVATLYAYKIDKIKEDELSNMVGNIIQVITDLRKELLYPVLQSYRFIPNKTSADMHGAASTIVNRNSQDNVSTDVMSIRGQGKSCFSFLEFADSANPILGLKDFLTDVRFATQESRCSPVDLKMLNENTKMKASVSQKLIFTTDTIGVGVLRKDNKFIFVLHTHLNPLLRDNWKLPIEAYLNNYNTVAQRRNGIEFNSKELPEAKYMEVKPLVEQLLKNFIQGDRRTVYGLGVIPNLPNIFSKDGAGQYIFKLEERSPQLPSGDDRNTQCKYTFVDGKGLINTVLESHWKDILHHSDTSPPSDTMPIWKIENYLKTTFSESRIPSSRAIENMVSQSTLGVTFGVFILDQPGIPSGTGKDKDKKVAIASVFICHKISTEWQLGTVIPTDVLTPISFIRTSKGYVALVKRTESTVSQRFADILPYILSDKENEFSLGSGNCSGLVNILELTLVFVTLTNHGSRSAVEFVWDAVNHILKSAKYQNLITSPSGLMKVEHGFHQGPSCADAWMIANSVSIDYGISQVGNLKCLVIGTKLPDGLKKWGFGPVVLGNINSARERVRVRPFSKEPTQTYEIDAFAKTLYTHLTTHESNFTLPQSGCGMFFPTQSSSISGPTSNWTFSYTIDSNTNLSTRSTIEEKGHQVELQMVTQIQNILKKTEGGRINDVKLHRKSAEILMFQEGLDEPSHWDFGQITSDKWKAMDYGAYIHLADNKRSTILTVLGYQGEQPAITSLETSIIDRAVEKFINTLKSSQLFRKVPISPEEQELLKTPQSQQLAQGLEHFIEEDLTKSYGTYGVSGIVRDVHSSFIVIEMFGGTIPIEKILEITSTLWRNNNTKDTLSPEQLFNLELGRFHWGDIAALLSSVLTSNSISCAYTTTAKRTFLVLELTFPNILPSNWSTPLDYFRKSVDDLRTLVGKPLVRILTTTTEIQTEDFIKAFETLEETNFVSGVSICNLTVISHKKVIQDVTQPENKVSPAVILADALTCIAKGSGISENANNDTREPFPAGAPPEGLIQLWGTTSFLDIEVVMQDEIKMMVQPSREKDSGGNYCDVVYIFCTISAMGRLNRWTQDILTTYFILNNLPKYTFDGSLLNNMTPEIPTAGNVVRFAYGSGDGFLFKYRSELQFPKDYKIQLIQLGLFQAIFEEVLKLKLLSHHTSQIKIVFGIKDDKDNKFPNTSVFISEGTARIE